MANQSLNNKRMRGEIRITDGSLWKNILLLSLPLMLSQLLQVLFNMADVAVVGKFSSAEALGAVGSTTILVSLFTGFLIGMEVPSTYASRSISEQRTRSELLLLSARRLQFALRQE